jgi:hypothetical protein
MIAALLVVAALAAVPQATQKPAPPPTERPATPAPQKPAPPAQRPSPVPPTRASESRIGVRGFGTLGSITFTARDSFATVFGSANGFVFGGGVQVLLPWGLYAEIGVSRFSRSDGERVFIGPGDEVFPLGIPLEVTVTPIEITGGWRYQPRRPSAPRPPAGRPPAAKPVPPPALAARGSWFPRWAIYGGGGYTSIGYREQSDFAGTNDNVSDRFAGGHVLGGGEYSPFRWMAVGGEVVWSSAADALGDGGVAAAFGEDNPGGTTVRLKISIGR